MQNPNGSFSGSIGLAKSFTGAYTYFMDKVLLLLLAVVSNGFAATDFISTTPIHLGTFAVRNKPGVQAEASVFHSGQPVTVVHYQNFNWTAVQVDESNYGEAFDAYCRSPLFDCVQPSIRIDLNTDPNDPFFPRLWGMLKIEAPRAWDRYTSNDVIVAVIDTGIDLNHEDLRDNLWTGPDGEHGYTARDLVLVPGGQDDHFHGTHCAGTIGGIGNNGVGVAGVNWRTKLMAMKFLRSEGFGLSTDAALLIDRMITLRKEGQNIRVTSNSWGSSGTSGSSILEDAFKSAEDVGILNFCAAGNDNRNTDLVGHTPSSLTLDGIISVMASDQSDGKAFFSNYGFVSTDLMAPGMDIISCRLTGGYSSLSGTSMATPHAAGVGAMLFGIAPELNVKQARDVMLDPASLDILAFTNNSTGGGRLNMLKTLTNPKIFGHLTNEPPVLTLSVATNFFVLNLGETLTVEASATDPNGDALTFVVDANSPQNDGLLMCDAFAGYRLRAVTNRYSVTNIPRAQDALVDVMVSVFDFRGASDSERIRVYMKRDVSLARDLSQCGFNLTVWLDTTDLAGPAWRTFMDSGCEVNQTLLVSGENGFSTERRCWEQSSQAAFSVQPGWLIFNPFVTDPAGNFYSLPDHATNHDGSTYWYPQIQVTVSTNSGPAPLHIVADMRGTDPTGTRNVRYGAKKWQGASTSFDTGNPVRTFTLTNLGANFIEFTAQETVHGVTDTHIAVFTVLPGVNTNAPPPPPPTPDPVLTPPQNLSASLSGTTIRLTWSDTALREDRYVVETRTKSKGPWTEFRVLATMAADSTAFSFMASRNTQYEFRLKACKESQCGGYSNVAVIRSR